MALALLPKAYMISSGLCTKAATTDLKIPKALMIQYMSIRFNPYVPRRKSIPHLYGPSEFQSPYPCWINGSCPLIRLSSVTSG